MFGDLDCCLHPRHNYTVFYADAGTSEDGGYICYSCGMMWEQSEYSQLLAQEQAELAREHDYFIYGINEINAG